MKADFMNYVDGTAYIKLLRSDFRDSYRFDAYARFMGQEGDDVVIIPIDQERATLLILNPKEVQWR